MVAHGGSVRQLANEETMGDSLQLIGKRLLLHLEDGRAANGLESKQATADRGWLRGTVRAVSVMGLGLAETSGGDGTTTPAAGLTVFVEFENATQRWSWVKVYSEGVKAVLLEDSVVWASYRNGTGATGSSAVAWPALVFRCLVDRVGLGSVVPVMYFAHNNLDFLPDKNSIQRFEIETDIRHPLLLEHPSLHAAISSWCNDFELQEIFRMGSYTIQGRRVRVYQPEFDECWALGMVSQHDPVSHIMEITLDKGKETQTVDPRVIHVMLVGEEIAKNGRKGSETMKGDTGRRRRTASETDDDLNLKRFKGAAEGRSSAVPQEGVGMWGGDSTVSSTTKNGCSTEGNLPKVLSPHLPFPGLIKENGRPFADSTSNTAHTLVPPPLKPAPSPFSTSSFPSLGQMPSLVPGAPAPKVSPSAQPEREEASPSAFTKTGPLVSPGPGTVSWSAPDTSPSVTLSASATTAKAPFWGTQTENSKALGFRVPQQASSVFGENNSQLNGTAPTTTQDPSRPFGFGFGATKNGTQPDQNLFMQCMNTGSASSLMSGPAKDTNYFTAVSESLNKDPLSLFKPGNDGQSKVPENHSTGNGVLNTSAAFPTVPSLGRNAASPGAQVPSKKNDSNGSVAGAVSPTGFNASENHQNLFLQGTKESTNPFLTSSSHTAFADLSGTKPQTSSDSNPNLFSMTEPPKAIITTQFSASSSLPNTASTSAPAPSQRTPGESSASKEPLQDTSIPSSSSSGGPEPEISGPSGMADEPVSFDHSQPQKFEERGQSSKRDSESSDNSDLSDLSENEEGPEKGQGPDQPPESSTAQQKGKAAPKSRPRNKSIKVGQSVLKDQSKVRRLKQSGESFLQDGSCINVAPHLHKCRECRLERYRKYRNGDEDSDEEDDPNVACRFFHFRRLAFTRKGILRVEGFLSPQQSDAMAMGLWLPSPAVQEGLDLDTSKYILANVGDQFCQLVMSEKEAVMMVEPHQKVAWKRAVRGVREMCDVCETTLFNIHWVCRKCGFGVCLDCYRLRKSKPHEDVEENPEDEVFSWLKCAKGQSHEPQNLMPTQIIPGAALYNIGDMVHSARGKWGIKANCPCTSRHTKSLVRPSAPNGISQSAVPSVGSPGAATPKAEVDVSVIKPDPASVSAESSSAETVSSTNSTSSTSTPSADAQASSKDSSALHWLADLAAQKSKDDTKESGSLRSMMNRDSRPPFGLDSLSALSKPSASSPKLFNSLLLGSSASQSKPEGSSLRDLLNSGPGKLQQGPGDSGVPFPSVFTSAGSDKKKSGLPNFLDHIIASVVETKKAEGRRSGSSEGGEMSVLGGRKDGVIGLSVLEPHTSHTWLCDGRLLCLQDPGNSNNWKIFRECWKQGQPVLVSGIHKRLKSELWRPEAFSEEFGDQDVDLVNCRNCAIISDVKVRDFWDGFQVLSKRLQDNEGNPMVLKLKDWPPGEDFRDMMPTRFHDLMDNLPLPEYTKRDGRLNLAARLPNFFVRPDLGPKMYNAYGLTATEDRKVGTTNLHLDVSDAVNVMVYVGIPQGDKESEQEVIATIEEGDVDEMTKRRIYEGKDKPGALWHIYAAKDAEKIRELLRKVGDEQGQENPSDHDPIHDQSWYLDQVLRRRLYEEYGVQGWAIVQFLGDAVFIPAGAPHQVHNLYSCIKVAEDFVSPEHVRHCFRLTQEFRHLSTTHTNHEDKLQVKNIIYHAVKDAVGTLKAHESKLTRP
ncbi:lysine-specific demethylase 3B isoform X2 [Eucyclogobius newberryi]|uniref:lysine-specific demethylase 3B isoform X2 n=1 Tax=Eucyclogobius newberryi TaxID=166745 RepID=UPI003B5A796B